LAKFRLRSENTATKKKNAARNDKLQELEEGYVRNSPTSPLHTNLCALRKKLKLQKNEMAQLMEVALRTYYAYEQGLRPIPSTKLIRLAVVSGVDLNELLLGRSAPTDLQAVRCAVDDLMLIIKFLGTEYPEMDEPTRTKVARVAVSTDWQGWSRMHPSIIRDAVRMVTRYRFHPEDMPAPPYWEDFGESREQYEAAMEAWQSKTDEDFDD
jgi:transcriptional regulator with XRE-family HTH domain